VPLSFAALPLRVRGRVLGALTLSSFEPERRFGPEDVAFLSGLADRAALALENARLYEQERTVAHTLQQSLLAGEPPPDARFRVATKYRPAVETLEVGGDWYDTFPVAEGTIGIVVGDVVGRGIQAASAMGQLRSAIRALAGALLGPARLIEPRRVRRAGRDRALGDACLRRDRTRHRPHALRLRRPSPAHARPANGPAATAVAGTLDAAGHVRRSARALRGRPHPAARGPATALHRRALRDAMIIGSAVPARQAVVQP
jgi:hypothetical protein